MKALGFEKSLEFDVFQTSEIWLGQWKKDFNVSFKTISSKYTFTSPLKVVASKCL